MHIFTETTTSDESWAVSWKRRRSQYVQSCSFPNILLDVWESLKALQTKLIAAALRAPNYFTFFPPRLASYPGHVGGGKSGLVSTVCACTKTPMISWGIVYHCLRTVNLYRIGPKHIRLQLIPRTAGKR